jgi:hypothetical protein
MSINLIESNSTNILSELNTISNSIVNNNLNITFKKNPKGSYGNILNNSSLLSGTTSSEVSISGYGNKAIIYYEDSTISSYDTLTLEVSIDGTNWDNAYLNNWVNFSPITNYYTNKRVYTAEINLIGITKLRLTNNSTTDTYSNIYFSVFN